MSRIDDYIACADEGLTQAETARKLGVSREAVRQAAERHSITFAQGDNRGIPHAGYASQSEAGRAWGVTPQAVSQAKIRSES